MSYLSEEEKEAWRPKLNAMLQDRVQRRAGVTSGEFYNQAQDVFANQMALRDINAMGSSLSKAASRMGTVMGKGEPSGLDKFGAELDASTQGAIDNMQNLRGLEERSNMNDLQTAKYLTDLDETDKARKMRREEFDIRRQEAANTKELQRLTLYASLGDKKAQQELNKARLQLDKDRLGETTRHNQEMEKKPSATGFRESAHAVDEENLPLGFDPSTRQYSKIPAPPGSKRKPPTATDAKANKGDQEAAYRYNILKQNAAELRALVEKNGTMELFGSAGAEMDRKIYDLAIDYAKLVDPESVAREGEVAAAQKYQLPIRRFGGLGNSNATALKLIDSYVRDLDTRLKARQDSRGGTPGTTPGESGGDRAPEEMSDAELEAELQRLKGGK